jgi:hypothetical protein
VPVGGDVVNTIYRPGGITPEIEDKLQEYVGSQRGGAMLVTLLAGCLVEWDLLDDRGKALPVTAETLRRLPIAFLAQVARAITEDMRPNLMSGERSAAG